MVKQMHWIKYLKRFILKACLLSISCLFLISLKDYGQTPMNTDSSSLPAIAKDLLVDSIHTLTIGETIPDIEITNILNYPAKTAWLHDFKGKLVIIDFWGSWCGGCIRLFPLLDTIQRKFKDKLIVFAVTAEDKEKIIPFLAKRKISNNVSFPIVTNDTLLGRLFPHYYVS